MLFANLLIRDSCIPSRPMNTKRKRSESTGTRNAIKRVKITAQMPQVPVEPPPAAETSPIVAPVSVPAPTTAGPKERPKMNKLVPPRPWPTMPTSVSATGPRSAHKEGKNYICMTRKSPLGAYLRRCKDVILKDGCAHRAAYIGFFDEFSFLI